MLIEKLIVIQGHFVPTGAGKLFVTQYSANEQPAKQAVLFLPSIFEEMNLCRAVVAKQAQFLSEHGFNVYCLDYFGCGDSEGEILEANADIWQQNILDTVHWLKQKGEQHLTLWGMRFGALLACQKLQDIHQVMPVKQLVWWKPVLKGKQFMTQFLRLKQAASMMQGQQNVKWREHILAGNTTEVAGYEICAELLGSIDSLHIPTENPEGLAPDFTVAWLELSANKITPVIQKLIDGWGGSVLNVSCFEGSAFWQIPEIFEQRFLHQPMLDALQQRPVLEEQKGELQC